MFLSSSMGEMCTALYFYRSDAKSLKVISYRLLHSSYELLIMRACQQPVTKELGGKHVIIQEHMHNKVMLKWRSEGCNHSITAVPHSLLDII